MVATGYYIAKKILTLRFNQLWRIFIDLGWVRSFILLFFILTPLVIQPRLLYWLAFPVILILHYSRKDAHFLQLSGNNPFNIFIIEYLAVIFPGLIVGLISEFWWPLLLIPLAVIVAKLPSKREFSSNKSRPQGFNPLPLNAFEWRSVFRQTRYFNYAIYIFLFIFAIFYSNTLPLSLAVVTFFMTSFYSHCESFQILEAFQRGPDRFLWYKISHALLYYTISIIPFIIIYLIKPVFPYYVPLFIYLGGLIWVINSVVLKYTLYLEGKDLKYSHAYTMYAILILFIFPIVPVLTASWLYWRARKRLKMYLYAFD